MLLSDAIKLPTFDATFFSHYKTPKHKVNSFDRRDSSSAQMVPQEEERKKYSRYGLKGLLREYVALKVAEAIAKHNNFSIHVPQVTIEQDSQSEFYLSRKAIHPFENLRDNPFDPFSSEAELHSKWLLQALVIDLILLNGDGHKGNLVKHLENGKAKGLICFDYDLANDEDYRELSVLESIQKMGNAHFHGGFAQASLFSGGAYNIDFATLLNIMKHNGTDKVVGDAFEAAKTAIKDHSTLNISDELLTYLDEFKTASLSQFSKTGAYKKPLASEFKPIAPPTPKRAPSMSQSASSRCSRTTFSYSQLISSSNGAFFSSTSITISSSFNDISYPGTSYLGTPDKTSSASSNSPTRRCRRRRPKVNEEDKALRPRLQK